MRRVSLSSTSPDYPVDDLEPFVEWAAMRVVIGLGETTHGTAEAFELKHRLIRALAEAGLLRTVAFECGLVGGRLINAYVRGGVGTAAEVLAAQGYWVWNNREVLALIEWLRSFNRDRAARDQVAFVGVDVQKVEGGLAELHSALKACSVSPDGRLLLNAATEFVEALMLGGVEPGSSHAIEAASLLFRAAELLHDPVARATCLNVARYTHVYLGPVGENRLLLRDEYMAATLLESLAERPGLAVVWAHNEHVALNEDF